MQEGLWCCSTNKLKKKDPKAFIKYSLYLLDQSTPARSYVGKCLLALFAQVNVTQHGLCLAMLQELQQAQNSPGQANLPALLLGFSQASLAYVLLLAPTSPLPQEILNAILGSARNPARFVYAHRPCLH